MRLWQRLVRPMFWIVYWPGTPNIVICLPQVHIAFYCAIRNYFPSTGTFVFKLSLTREHGKDSNNLSTIIHSQLHPAETCVTIVVTDDPGAKLSIHRKSDLRSRLFIMWFTYRYCCFVRTMRLADRVVKIYLRTIIYDMSSVTSAKLQHFNAP